MAPSVSAPLYTQWQNNTATWWFRDRGLRLCMANILVLFLCVFAQGFDGILLNGLQALPSWLDSFHDPDSNTLGLISAAYGFPSLIVPYFVQILTDRFGRRRVIVVGAALGIAGPLISGLGHTLGSFIAGRVVTGCSTSFMQVSAPSLIAEVAHPRFRAVVTASLQCTYFLGAAVAGWTTFGVTNWSSEWAWRAPVIIQCAGCVPVLIWSLCPLMVESPRWLAYRDRQDQAHELLAKLHANGDRGDELVLHEVAEIQEAAELERQASGSNYLDFFRTRGNRKRVATAIFFGFITQMSGNSLSVMYLPKILALVGMTAALPVEGINGGLSLYLLFVSLTMAQFVERLGRRRLLLGGFCGMIIFLALQTAFTSVSTANPSVGIAAVPMIFLFMTCYSFCLTSLPFLYLTEILPYRLRAKGLAVYACAQAVMQVYSQYGESYSHLENAREYPLTPTSVTPFALAGISWRYYFVLLACDVVAIVVVWFLIIETKGRTLEEIDELFDGPELAVSDPAEHKIAGLQDAKDVEERREIV